MKCPKCGTRWPAESSLICPKCYRDRLREEEESEAKKEEEAGVK
jgi:ssDNA-binding Zn-finger/Zn-ribbon topoisomerase 1